jgi:hypothetical protein
MAAEQAAEAEQATAAAAAGGGAAGASAAAAAAAAMPAAATAGVDVHGPVPQADLLHALGIQHRLEALAQVRYGCIKAVVLCDVLCDDVYELNYADPGTPGKCNIVPQCTA